MCDRLIAEMKAIFGEDQRHIDHALEVLENTTQLIEAEGGDALVVKAAAILYDIGNGGTLSVAGAILEELGVDTETAEHIRQIVACYHSSLDVDTVEFRIVWDATWLH